MAAVNPLGLTKDEREVIRLLGEAATIFRTRVLGKSATHDQDLAEFESAIHVLQRMVGGQAAARAHPDEYRLLGEVLPGRAPDLTG